MIIVLFVSMKKAILTGFLFVVKSAIYAQSCLYPAPGLTLGYSANAIASGDFNGDGFVDLAVGKQGGVDVFTGNGSGSFSSAFFIALPPLPPSSQPVRALLVKDLNADAKLDILLLNEYDGVRVALGGGNATFTLNNTVYMGCIHPLNLAVDDFNNDASLDLVISNFCSTVFTRHLGNGTGGFIIGPYTPFPATAQNCYGAVSNDFNGDGNKDLALPDRGGNRILVFMGLGNGSFSPLVSYTIGTEPKGLNCADFNNDGHKDLLASLTGADSVALILGSASGTFAPATRYAVNAFPQALQSSDFNGDGFTDLLVAHSNSLTGNVSLLLGNNTGFNLPLVYPVGLNPVDITINDFNNDGYPDFASANQTGSSVSVYLSAYPKITGASSVCAGSPLSLSVTALPGSTYFWQSGATSSVLTITPNTSAQFSVLVTNSVCAFTAVKSIDVKPQPTINVVSNKPILCVGESVTLTASGANMYLWSFFGAVTPTLSVSPSSNTNYTVTGTNQFACTNKAVFTQSVSGCTGLNDTPTHTKRIEVWPNPNNGIFTLRGLGKDMEAQMEIFDVVGKKVFSSTVTEGQTIDLSKESKGVYFHILYNEKHTITGRIVIQ
jgi:hypothetical protein